MKEYTDVNESLCKTLNLVPLSWIPGFSRRRVFERTHNAKNTEGIFTISVSS